MSDDLTLVERRIDEAVGAGDFESALRQADSYVRSADTQPPTSGLDQSTWFRSRWFAAQVADRAGRSQAAFAWTSQLLPHVSQLSDSLQVRVTLLAADLSLRLGQRDEARERLGDGFDARFQQRLDEQPRLLLNYLRIRLRLGDVLELVDQVEVCDQRLGEDVDHRALLWSQVGLAWEVAGDLESAEKCWHRGAALCDEPRGHVGYANLQVQLGRLAHLRGSFQAALDCYDRAESRLPKQSPQVIEIHMRRLLVRKELGQHSQAQRDWECLRAARRGDGIPVELESLSRTLAAVMDGSVSPECREEVRGYQALQFGDRPLARQCYESAFAEANSPERRARFALALAAIATTDRNSAQAGRWLAEAESGARQNGLPEVLWRVLELRGEYSAATDDNDAAARRCFLEAIQISESQFDTLRDGTNAATYRLHQTGLLGLLVRGAAHRGDAAAVFRYQELHRGRLLCEMSLRAARLPHRMSAERQTRLDEVERALRNSASQLSTEVSRRLELIQDRDQILEELFADQSRRGSDELPALPGLHALQASLSAGEVFVSPSVVGDELFLLVVRCDLARVVAADSGGASQTLDALARFQLVLNQCLTVYQMRLWGTESEPLKRLAENLIDSLSQLGESPFGHLLAKSVRPGERVYWAADERLQGLPLAGLRRKRKYFIEQHEVVHCFSGALHVHQKSVPLQRRRWAPSLVIASEPGELASAATEARHVAATLWRSRLLIGTAARREVIESHIRRSRIVHFACHAEFDPQHPLDAHLCLPSGETWRTLEWASAGLTGLPLVTFSACQSAVVSEVAGREVFGLVTGALTAGVRAVVAGMWSLPDRETARFMSRFYYERLSADLATALARTQRAAILETGESPLSWAPFALFGLPEAVPRSSWFGRLWGRFKHERLVKS